MPKLREEPTAEQPDAEQRRKGFWQARHDRERCVGCLAVKLKEEMLELDKGRLCRCCCNFVTARYQPFTGSLGGGGASGALGAGALGDAA